MALEVLPVIEHTRNLTLLELLPGKTVLIDVFFPAAEANFAAVVGLPNIRMPTIGWALSDDDAVTDGTIKITEI
jgi:hypothetical protein